jgi:hypothetical protein
MRLCRLLLVKSGLATMGQRSTRNVVALNKPFAIAILGQSCCMPPALAGLEGGSAAAIDHCSLALTGMVTGGILFGCRVAAHIC